MHNLTTTLHRHFCRFLAVGCLLLTVQLGACSSSGVDERHLNNNETGLDQDATRHAPDTVNALLLDTAGKADNANRSSLALDSTAQIR